MEKKNEKFDVESALESLYPSMTDEFKKICMEQYSMFCAKMANYGKGNIMLGGDINNEEDRNLALKGIAIRMNDKTNRLINLLLRNKQDVVNESTIDTFQDIVNYAIIALIIQRQMWK
jgi:hypothetical protein